MLYTQSVHILCTSMRSHESYFWPHHAQPSNLLPPKHNPVSAYSPFSSHTEKDWIARLAHNAAYQCRHILHIVIPKRRDEWLVCIKVAKQTHGHFRYILCQCASTITCYYANPHKVVWFTIKFLSISPTESITTCATKLLHHICWVGLIMVGNI